MNKHAGVMRVCENLSLDTLLTEFHTTDRLVRIRFKRVPPTGEFEEFDLRRFRVGEVYDVPTQLAMLLVVAGHAELVSTFVRAEPADMSRPPRSNQPRR